MAKRDSRRTYEEIMRRRALAQAEAPQRVIERIEAELRKLMGKLQSVRGQEDRILLKAEIAHLRKLKARLIGRPGRKPPEAGLPVPAIPPGGPLPRSGGAAVPLDFGRD